MNIDREFIKWFYEEQYPELGSNRRQCFGMADSTKIDVIDYWMREAFRAGVKSAQGARGSDTQVTMPLGANGSYEIGSLMEQRAFEVQRNYPL